MEIIDFLKDRVKKHPNDYDLGEAIRSYVVNHNKYKEKRITKKGNSYWNENGAYQLTKDACVFSKEVYLLTLGGGALEGANFRQCSNFDPFFFCRYLEKFEVCRTHFHPF